MKTLNNLIFSCTLLIITTQVSFGQTEDSKYLANEIEEENIQRIEIVEENLPASIRASMQETHPKAIWVEGFRYINEEGEAVRYTVRLEQMDAPDVLLTYDGEGSELEEKKEKRHKDKMKSD